MNTYQSRWGFHPCDYETYLLLKQLNRLHDQALHACADWQRWARKQPQNRVLRRQRRNDQGQRIGSEVVGPRPEPPLVALFCSKARLVQAATQHTLGVRVAFDGLRIPEVYRQARTPAPTAAAVLPLPWTADELRALLARAADRI